MFQSSCWVSIPVQVDRLMQRLRHICAAEKLVIDRLVSTYGIPLHMSMLLTASMQGSVVLALCH